MSLMILMVEGAVAVVEGSDRADEPLLSRRYLISSQDLNELDIEKSSKFPKVI